MLICCPKIRMMADIESRDIAYTNVVAVPASRR